ncbi:MAG: alpha/beta fold hydrolase [Gemmatimonadaceae bacterium]
MPHLDLDEARLFYQDSGGTGPAVVFSHGLLFDHRMFDAQVAALRDRFRCIAYDHRGQGQSTSPPMRWYDMETCYRDAVQLIEALGAAPCHFVGLSMGGFVGLRLAIRRPDMLRSLTLLDTSADPEPADNVPKYRMLNLIAKLLSIRLVAGRVMPILFGASFLADPARDADRAMWRARVMDNGRDIAPAVLGVIFRDGVADELAQIHVPTLIAVGAEDVATVPDKSRAMHAVIPGSRFAIIPNAGHSSSIEQPTLVTQALAAFLSDVHGARA